MKRFLTILIILLTGSGLYATGYGNPNLHLTDDTVYLTGNINQEILQNTNHITYTGSDSVELKWEVIEFDVPSSWTVGFCAGLNCNIINSTSSNKFYIQSGASSLMDLQVSPLGNVGTGTVKIAVYPSNGTVNDGVIITHLITVNPVSVNRTPVINFMMYPNPVKDYLNINFTRKGNQHIEIYNILGNKILVKDFENVDFAKIPFSNYQRGRYIVVYRSETGKVITKTISKE